MSALSELLTFIADYYAVYEEEKEKGSLLGDKMGAAVGRLLYGHIFDAKESIEIKQAIDKYRKRKFKSV